MLKISLKILEEFLNSPLKKLFERLGLRPECDKLRAEVFLRLRLFLVVSARVFLFNSDTKLGCISPGVHAAELENLHYTAFANRLAKA